MGEAKFRARRSATPGTTAICSLLNRSSLHDNHTTDPQNHTANSSGRSMVTSPGFLRRDAQTLNAIRSLPRSANLVLFTPVVPPEPGPEPELVSSSPNEVKYSKKAAGRASADAPMDPFEPFGRALSRHHARVRHVPYVPSVGMTGTHKTFLQHASAIVLVVVCNRGEEGRKRAPSSGSTSLELHHHQRQLPDRSSSYILPPPRQSSITPTPASFKHEPRPSPHRGHWFQPDDPFFKFASQTLTAAAGDLRARAAAATSKDRDPLSAPSIPTVLLVVGEDEAETMRRADQLDTLMEELAASLGMRFELGAKTALVSRSYSAGALRKAAGLIFGSEA